MDEQGYRFGVGVLVVASLVIGVILILFFGAAPNLFERNYDVTIRFDAAPGVGTDTPVRKNGVQIGRVKEVKLLEGTKGVDLTLELDSQYEVRAGELPRIGTGSIFGDAVVEFVPPTPDSLIARFDGLGGSPANRALDDNENELAMAVLTNGDFLSGGTVAPEPFEALIDMQASLTSTVAAIESTMSSVESAGNEFTALARDVRTMIGGGDGDLRRITQKTEMTIDNINATMQSIDTLFRDPALKNALDTVSQRLPELVNEAERVMQQTERTLASFEGVGRAAEDTMRNVEEFTAPLGEQGDKIVEDVLGTIRNLDSLLGDLKQTTATVNQVAKRINDGQGTFAKLVDDPELYYSLINTLNNVETLTRRLQPVVEDARIFTDKVARDPSSIIDLRGALTGRSGTGGVKHSVGLH